MKVTTVVESTDGQVELTLNLSAEQAKFLLEVGINVVLAKGGVNFFPKIDPSQAHAMPQQVQ